MKTPAQTAPTAGFTLRDILIAIALLAIMAATLFVGTRPLRAQPTIGSYVSNPELNFTASPTNLSLSNAYDANTNWLFNVVTANSYTNIGSNNTAFLIRPGYGFAVDMYVTNASADAGKHVQLSWSRALVAGAYDVQTNYFMDVVLIGTNNHYTTNYADSLCSGFYAVSTLVVSNGCVNPIGLAETLGRPVPWPTALRGY